MSRRPAVAVVIVAVALLAVYAPVLTSLIRQWSSDENYSHGLLVVPFALLFAWRSRGELSAPPRPQALGLAVVAVSMAVFLAGQFAIELFLMRVSLIGVLAGSILYLWGPIHLRRLAFPLVLLLLAVPLPAVVLNQIAFPLQLLASRAGEAVVSAAGIPVLREGNVLVLADTKLEVVQACSGIRSLAALLTLGLILGKLAEPRRWARVALAIVTIPVAIVANAARVAGTGLAASWIGPQAAEGFFHTFSGWLVFVVAFVALMACARLLARVPLGHRPVGIYAA